jgi:hypothetical protein
MLRRFLYLDTELTSEFLAQVDQGVFTEEEQRDVVKGDRKLGGDVRAGLGPLGVGVEATRGSSGEAEATRTLRQTPESAFARLFEVLSSSGDVQWLEVLDDEVWRQLHRGEIVEVESVVSVSSIAKFTTLADQVTPLMDAMEAFGEAVDTETRTAITTMSSLRELFGTRMPVIARAAGALKFKFIANLQVGSVRVDLDELEGEATLFAKIQRKLGPSEKHTVLESLPGLGSLPRSVRRNVQASIKNEKDLPDLVVSAPAAVVTPLAIYR